MRGLGTDINLNITKGKGTFEKKIKWNLDQQREAICLYGKWNKWKDS